MLLSTFTNISTCCKCKFHPGFHTFESESISSCVEVRNLDCQLQVILCVVSCSFGLSVCLITLTVLATRPEKVSDVIFKMAPDFWPLLVNSCQFYWLNSGFKIPFPLVKILKSTQTKFGLTVKILFNIEWPDFSPLFFKVCLWLSQVLIN